jgi:hypothetical protein
MPMDFPDFESLKQRAQVRDFRQPFIDESEEDFRQALRDHVAKVDVIEAMEISTKNGWDRWDVQ